MILKTTAMPDMCNAIPVFFRNRQSHTLVITDGRKTTIEGLVMCKEVVIKIVVALKIVDGSQKKFTFVSV